MLTLLGTWTFPPFVIVVSCLLYFCPFWVNLSHRYPGNWYCDPTVGMPDTWEPPKVTWHEQTKEWHLTAHVFWSWPGNTDKELKFIRLVVGQTSFAYSESRILRNCL